MEHDEKKAKAKRVVAGLLALTPPGPEDTDPLEWGKKVTLLAEQLCDLQKLQREVLKETAPILLGDESPLVALLAIQYAALLTLKLSGRAMLKANRTEPDSLLELQKSKARDLLGSQEDIPEELRDVLLELLGKEEPANDDEQFFPKEGLTLPFDGKVH